MNKTKTFDAVEMKNAIQARRRQERGGMTDEEARLAIAGRLDTSDHPLSRKWRGLAPNRTKA